MDMVKSQFVSEMIDGQTYWITGSELRVREKSPSAYLLPNYDEFFIGFKDRSAISKVAKKAGIKKDDQALLAHIILLDGQVVGGWRRTLNKDSVIVEATLITSLTKEEEQAVRQAADKFGEFLELPVTFTHKESQNGQRKTRSF